MLQVEALCNINLTLSNRELKVGLQGCRQHLLLHHNSTQDSSKSFTACSRCTIFTTSFSIQGSSFPYFQTFNCTHLHLEGSTTFSFHLRRIGFHSISPPIWVNIVNLHYCVCFPFPVATSIGRFSTAFIIFLLF